GQTQPAIANFKVALRVQADYEPALIGLADLQVRQMFSTPVLSQEAYEQVEKAADVLLAKDARSFDGLRLRGQLAVVDGHYDVAQDLFSRAARVRPDEPELQISLANAMARNKQGAEAERIVLSLIEKHPDFGPAYDFLQLQYSLQNRAVDVSRVV